MKTYCWPVRVYYEDTDHGGVVYYANYLKYMERCRTEMLRAKGLEQDQIINDSDLMFAVKRVEIGYYLPAKFNDQLLITAEVTHASKVQLKFTQSIFRAADPVNECGGMFAEFDKINTENELLCDAKISIASLSKSQLRPKRIPDPLFEELLREH